MRLGGQQGSLTRARVRTHGAPQLGPVRRLYVQGLWESIQPVILPRYILWLPQLRPGACTYARSDMIASGVVTAPGGRVVQRNSHWLLSERRSH